MNKRYKFLIGVFMFLLSLDKIFLSTKMFLDNVYEVKYINYENLDFNNSTSTDTYNKFYSNLNTTLKVNIDKMEFKLSFCSIGEFGNFNPQLSTFTYSWQRNLPYPNINFLPWISESYIKYIYDININFLKIEDISLTFTVGRHRKEFIEGLVLGDNGIGYDGVSFNFKLGRYFYIDSIYSRIRSDIYFTNNKYFDLYSYLVGSNFYNGFNFGVNNTIEDNNILGSKKIFYEFFIKRELPNYYYIFEYAIQTGNSNNEKYSGNLWFLKASTVGKNKYLGRSKASLIWLLSSGGDDSNIFLPSFSKKYNFLEPYGYGEFSNANINNIYFDLPDGYSGIFVLGFDLSINPFKNFFANLGYYLLSSPSAPDNGPEPTATEKTLGAKKAIGVEYDIGIKYEISEFLSLDFTYSIFNPTKGAYQNKPKDDNAIKTGIYIKSRF